MKIFFLFPVMGLLVAPDDGFTRSSLLHQPDTTIITHTLDGHTIEWPEEKFTTDKSTKTQYAIDNDNQTLFMALNIPDKVTQQKVMQNGLTLFVDIKGKKKENRGADYPLGLQNNPNIEMVRVFGFADQPLTQNIKTEGSINIALAWDTSYVLHLEYLVPFRLLGSPDELKDKKISIGWKINEEDVPAPAQPVSTTTRVVAVPAGSRPPANRNSGTNRNELSPPSYANKAQTIWSTYTIAY